MHGSTLLLLFQNAGSSPSTLVSTWDGLGRPMRRPSPRLFPSLVTILPVTGWRKDPAAGRTSMYGARRGPIACAVQPSSSAHVPEHMREQFVVYHTVKFYDDPLVNLRDVLIYGARQLVVMGVEATSGGRGRTWLVHCEERPTPPVLGS